MNPDFEDLLELIDQEVEPFQNNTTNLYNNNTTNLNHNDPSTNQAMYPNSQWQIENTTQRPRPKLKEKDNTFNQQYLDVSTSQHALVPGQELLTTPQCSPERAQCYFDVKPSQHVKLDPELDVKHHLDVSQHHPVLEPQQDATDLSEHVVLEPGQEATKKYTDLEGKGKNLSLQIEAHGTSIQYSSIINRYWVAPGKVFLMEMIHPPMKENEFLRFMVNHVVPGRKEHVVRACGMARHNETEKSPCILQIKAEKNIYVQYYKDDTSGKLSIKVFPKQGTTITQMKAYMKCRNTCSLSGNAQDKDWALITTLERNNEIIERVCTDVKVVERPKEEKLRVEKTTLNKASGNGRGRKRKLDGIPLTPPSSAGSHCSTPYSMPCTPSPCQFNPPTPTPPPRTSTPYSMPCSPSPSQFNPPTPTPPPTRALTPVPAATYSLPPTPHKTENEVQDESGEVFTVYGEIPQMQMQSNHAVPLLVNNTLEIIQCNSEQERQVHYVLNDIWTNQDTASQARIIDLVLQSVRENGYSFSC